MHRVASSHIAILSLAGIVIASACTVGQFSGFLLAEPFGPIGWVMGVTLAAMLAVASVVVPLTGRGRGLAVLAVTVLSFGLGAARVRHGLVEAQAAVDAPRIEAQARLDARLARADAARDAAVAVAQESKWKTRETGRAHARHAAEVAAAKAEIIVPERAPRVSLSTMSWTDWAVVAAPVIVEFAAALLVKAIGAALAQWLLVLGAPRREEAVTPEASEVVATSGGGVDASKLSAAAQRGLDLNAGTWRGLALGEAKLRGGVLWPTLADAKRTVYIGTVPARRMAGEKVDAAAVRRPTLKVVA